jgi:hypothetical protein
LISEQKIDDIARDIGGIKLFLDGLNVPSNGAQPVARPMLYLDQVESTKPQDCNPISTPGGESSLDESAQIIDFVKSFLSARNSKNVDSHMNEVTSSLVKLLQVLDGPADAPSLSFLTAKTAGPEASPSMPPLEAVLTVLRWAKGRPLGILSGPTSLKQA